ncbi:type VI secretion system ATPase TssH [Myxococcus landrumensis]|uniref:Type VI secretion system ATPase TssH n=1 Tax=Myxococcus landrumensis TaxID=2813577 RepID=A0ABX7NFH5_9BACT|nr:type VI secretion system ATPase TssH [Myxococcus landrumus]QSQ15053.1 type VI secretion system ATPase TssH [Myxococcus landrumus]
MRVEPKTLVRRLTPTATRMLETAVSRASSARCYEIVPEHLLRQLLEDEEGEASLLLRHFQVDRAKVLASVEDGLKSLRTGNSGRPVFSESLFQWFEDAWLVASLEHGVSRLRSGVLMWQWIARSERYTAESYSALDAISVETLKKVFEEVVGRSKEAAEVSSATVAAPSGGGGRGEEALSRFTTSFTEKARSGKIDPIFGRDREIRQVIDVLARRRKNNPIIVGEPGVGKTALVEGLARAIVAGDVPESMRNLEVLGLDLGALQAGAGVRGEFENRLKAVISEVKGSPKPIILFIDEAHTIIGAGGAQGGGDAANLLKPELARGELRTIAATTWAEYKKYFEKDAALERRFQPIKVDEPSEEDAVLMLRGLCPAYAKSHGVTIRDEAVVAAVSLSHRYISGRQLPDKAVDLLDTAAARVKIEQSARPDELVEVESRLAALERELAVRERELAAGHPMPPPEDGPTLEERLAATRDSVATLRARWEQELAAVDVVRRARAELDAAKEGADVEKLKADVAEARAQLEKLQGESPLIHVDVDPDVVARVVAGWTGVPVGKLRSSSVGAVLTLEQTLRSRVKGQDAALRAVAETIRMSHAGIRNPSTPIGVLLFVGPSGVGKTETALALADTLYGGDRFLTTINMSEFQEKHTVSRLIGSPPGYVGYGEGGVLTEAVRQRPYSVVLLDECEKADLEVMNLFYQVFDKGMLSDGEGRLIDFRNTVVILTSNLATDALMQLYSGPEAPKTETVTETIRPILSRHFKPALLARMSVVPFIPIARDVLKDIAQMKLAALADRLHTSHRVKTEFAPEVTEEFARRCLDNDSGARNVDHLLRSSLMPRLSMELLERLAAGGVPGRLRVGLGASGDWDLSFSDA